MRGAPDRRSPLVSTNTTSHWLPPQASRYTPSPQALHPPSVLIRRPSPYYPMPSTSTSPPPSLQSVPGPPGPSHGRPCRPPFPFQLYRPCLHWSRLSLSPAGPLSSVIHLPDQCGLNIRYPLHSLHPPCPMLNPLPPFTYHIVRGLL